MCHGFTFVDSNPFCAASLLIQLGRSTTFEPNAFLPPFRLNPNEVSGGTAITESEVALVATTIVFVFSTRFSVEGRPSCPAQTGANEVITAIRVDTALVLVR